MNQSDQMRVAQYLARMIEAIHRIGRYTVQSTELTFLEDEKTQDAVVRNFEIIGEACNNISKKHPDFASALASS